MVGVTPVGIVRGVMMDRKDKDLFRQSLDNTLRRMDPVNPMDEDLILAPVFKPVLNHPSTLRLQTALPLWDRPDPDKTAMVIQVEVRQAGNNRQFTYDGEAFDRSPSGHSIRVALKSPTK